MRFELLCAGLPFQRQLPVTVQVPALNELVRQEAQLGHEWGGSPYRRCRLQPPSDSRRFLRAPRDCASDHGDMLRVSAQTRRGTGRTRRQLDVGCHALDGADEPEAGPRSPASSSRVERMENVTGVSVHRREVTEVPRREIGMQHCDPRFGRGRCGETLFFGG